MDSKDRLITDFARLWLAHDGLWFQAVEQEFGMEAAIHLDAVAWNRFSPLEAQRILKRLGKEPGGGLDLLEEALGQRLYAFINEQRIVEKTEDRLVFEMVTCRVQEARQRKNMPPFPCKEVGLVEYSAFASAIDSRIQTRCLGCPPDRKHPDFWCRWEFTIPR